MSIRAIPKTPARPSVGQEVLHRAWADRRVGIALALLIAALAGVLVALAMPRGPATTVQALMVLAAGLAVGTLAGLVMQSRWAYLLVPIAHVIAIEITRAGAPGPTVDLPRLDSAFGVLALILGRGFHGLVGLLPMLVGVGIGSALGRRWAGAPSGHRSFARRLPLLTGAVIVIALIVALAIPASTPRILGTDGRPLPGSIAEMRLIPVGEGQQAIVMRGQSVDNPVLLYLSGGPGQSDLPYVRAIFQDLEHDFVVVAWDQRGVGKSYAALDPTATLTLDSAVDDVAVVANYLRERFDEEKIYLAGVSWGSTLGVLAVQRHPELYHAWIGSGQMVSQRETDQRLYADLLALADARGDAGLRAQLEAYGAPPYQDLMAYVFVMGYYDALTPAYTPSAGYLERGRAANLGPWGVLAQEYDLVEKVNVMRGFMDEASRMYPQLQGLDFRRDVPRLEVPVYLFDGAAELTARRALAWEWFERLDAPSKQMFTFADASHTVAMEQVDAFHQILLETIVPETYPGR